MSFDIDMEQLYSVFRWIEDIHSVEGRERFEKSIDVFKKVVEHRWVADIIEKKRSLRIVDVCGGTGIGGIALAKVLMDRGIDVYLVVNDVRKSALEKAKVFAREVLGKDIEILYANAIDIHRYGIKADIALLYGLSTPHFSPWDMIRLTVSIASILDREGIFVVEEVDRQYTVFFRIGYKHVLSEKVGDDYAILSIHRGYDFKTGMFERLMIELPSGRKARAPVFFWSIAETASILWVFFRDVDFIAIDSMYRGFLIARESRGIDPELYSSLPTMLRKE